MKIIQSPHGKHLCNSMSNMVWTLIFKLHDKSMKNLSSVLNF